MTMPVEVLRKLEAAAKLEAELAEQEGNPEPNPLLGLVRGSCAQIARWLGARRDHGDERSTESLGQPADKQ